MQYRVRLGIVLFACMGLAALCSTSWASALGDIVYLRPGSTEKLAAAYFPHWVHRASYTCYACHDELFAMQRGANPTMAIIARGESCGACHNGKTAFGVDACHRCHVRQ